MYDGLWRCLCPSVGFKSLTRTLRSQRVRPTLFTSQTVPCQRTQQRQNSTSTVERREPAEFAESILSHKAYSRRQYLDRADNRAPWLNKLLSVRPGAAPEQLDQFSTTHIYDGLKELQSMEGSYRSIIMLVEFLVSVRREPPNAPLYEALIRANVDPFRGSARVAKALLREMADSGIPTTPGIYNAVLQVRISLSFFTGREPELAR